MKFEPEHFKESGRKVLVIDTETTGLPSEEDKSLPDNPEILQLVILDESECELFNRYFCPVHHNQWIDAEKVNGISPNLVKNKPCFSECIKEVQQIIKNADLIVAYNAQFDLEILQKSGIDLSNKNYFCLMRAFARLCGVRNNEGGYRWQTLRTCAHYYGYPAFREHDALSDAQAALFCYHAILADKRWYDTNRKGVI